MVFYILLPIGLIFLCIALGVGTYQHRFLSNALVTEGTVIGNVRQGKGYTPEIAFRTQQGKEGMFTPSFSSSPPMYKKGDKMLVAYQGDGENARILSFATRFGLPWVFLCVGLAMIIIAFGFRYGDSLVISRYLNSATLSGGQNHLW